MSIKIAIFARWLIDDKGNKVSYFIDNSLYPRDVVLN